MRYLGGKSRLAKKIVGVIKARAPETLGVCEPFMGGGAMTLELAKWRPVLAGDRAPGLADLYRAIGRGFRLPSHGTTFEEYNRLKTEARQGVVSPLHTAVGFFLTFGGMWFRGAHPAEPTQVYAKQFNTNAEIWSQQNNIYLVQDACDFTDWRNYMRPGMTVYADPPYEGTEPYRACPVWISDIFYKEARIWRELGARVFISEFDCPFTCIWKEHRKAATSQPGLERKSAIDRLYEVDP